MKFPIAKRTRRGASGLNPYITGKTGTAGRLPDKPDLFANLIACRPSRFLSGTWPSRAWRPSVVWLAKTEVSEQLNLILPRRLNEKANRSA
jgi:hypothetical protein